MSETGVFVPGTFSQVGRTTKYDIDNLQSQLKLNADDDNAKARETSAIKAKSKASAKGSNLVKNQEEVKPKTPGGELAKAIQEKLRASATLDVDDAKGTATVAKSTSALNIERRNTQAYTFKSEEGDSKWTSKFTATYDIGSLNNRNEDHPAPAWYKVRHDMVLDRPPAWDIQEHPKHVPSDRYGFGQAAQSHMTFFTDVDIENKDTQQTLTARQRAMLRLAEGVAPEKVPGKIGSSMSLNSPRGPLGKVGRTHVIMNDHSCAYDGDLLEQDIKGYPKLRYPQWDFGAPEGRKPLIKEDSLGEPGKYDVRLDCVKPAPQTGVGFGKAMCRSQCVSLMGYSAPPAVLHPEEKRTRGLLPDRSKAKNFVRHRITHVNDFDRELPRPPLLSGGNEAFHDESDPEACEAVHQRSMTYDAPTADVAVTHRRDIAPKYARMLGRGRDAVQGLRALSSDLSVRGSVGLGFHETTNDHDRSVQQREGRAADGSKENPNKGPRFQHRTLHEHNDVTERILRGAPFLRGTGANAKPSPLMKKDSRILTNAFKRSASLPGYESRSRYGGTRVLSNSRSSVAMPGWSPAEFDGEES